MKKYLSASIAGALVATTLAFTACVDNKGASVVPESTRMQSNLESSGYSVTVTETADGGRAKHLIATKGDDYIECYWPDSDEDCARYSQLLQNKRSEDHAGGHRNEHSGEHHSDSHLHGQTQNADKHGNVVYCATEHAATAAGIVQSEN